MTERGGRTPHVLCNESLRAPQEGVGMWVERRLVREEDRAVGEFEEFLFAV
jgi:hypothetical protein